MRAPAMLAPALTESLCAVAATMAEARGAWWVIAGAAVALHGVGEASDVDVLLSPEDVPALAARLTLTAAVPDAHPRFRSAWFATWREAPLPVEFMAGLRVEDGGEWRAIRPVTRLFVEAGECRVPIPERRELAAILRQFGRPKDLRRAALLDG